MYPHKVVTEFPFLETAHLYLLAIHPAYTGLCGLLQRDIMVKFCQQQTYLLAAAVYRTQQGACC